MADVRGKVLDHFEKNPDRVFYTRQLEVEFERDFFHWLTAWSIRELKEQGVIVTESRGLSGGNEIHLSWHKKNRYWKRAARQLVAVVEAFSDPAVTEAVGLNGQMLVMHGFARNQFVMIGENANTYKGIKWTDTKHDMDFIFERDGVGYGIEVKNTLGYMDKEEFEIKIKLCRKLGIWPVFACRMLPKSWIYELNQFGGYAMIMKYWMFPISLSGLVARIRGEVGLPVDCPKALLQGTMDKFIGWHEKNL